MLINLSNNHQKTSKLMKRKVIQMMICFYHYNQRKWTKLLLNNLKKFATVSIPWVTALKQLICTNQKAKCYSNKMKQLHWLNWRKKESREMKTKNIMFLLLKLTEPEVVIHSNYIHYYIQIIYICASAYIYQEYVK